MKGLRSPRWYAWSSLCAGYLVASASAGLLMSSTAVDPSCFLSSSSFPSTLGSLCTAVRAPLAGSIADQRNDCLPWCAAGSTTTLELMSHTRPRAASSFTLREVVVDIDACTATSIDIILDNFPRGIECYHHHTRAGG